MAKPPEKRQNAGFAVHAAMTGLVAMVGTAAGFGPSWIQHDFNERIRQRHYPLREPIPVLVERPDLSPPPTIQKLVDALTEPKAQPPNQSPSPPPGDPLHFSRKELDRLGQLWETHQQTPAAELLVPAEAQQLLDGTRPFTADTIAESLQDLPYLVRIRCLTALTAQASPAECKALIDHCIEKPFHTLEVEQAILNALVQSWAKRDPKGAFDALRLPLATPEHSLLDVHYLLRDAQSIAAVEWIQVEPAPAAAAILSVPLADSRETLLQAVASVVRDPYLLLHDSRGDSDSETALPEIQMRAAVHDPVRFIELLQTGAFPQNAVEAAFRKLARNDPDDARNRMEQLPAHGQRTAAIKGILAGWGATAPVAALEWVRYGIENEHLDLDHEGADRTLFDAWIAESEATDWRDWRPEEATRWVRSLEENPPALEIRSIVLEAWIAENPKAAWKELGDMKPSNETTRLQQMALAAWIPKEPVVAWEKLKDWPHYTERVKLMLPLGKAWAEADEPTARAWIEDELIGRAQSMAFKGYLGQEVK